MTALSRQVWVMLQLCYFQCGDQPADGDRLRFVYTTVGVLLMSAQAVVWIVGAPVACKEGIKDT